MITESLIHNQCLHNINIVVVGFFFVIFLMACKQNNSILPPSLPSSSHSNTTPALELPPSLANSFPRLLSQIELTTHIWCDFLKFKPYILSYLLYAHIKFSDKKFLPQSLKKTLLPQAFSLHYASQLLLVKSITPAQDTRYSRTQNEGKLR